MVIQARKHQEEQNENEPSNFQKKPISIDPKTWVKLGHFHLLLEEYRKGNLSSLSQEFNWNKKKQITFSFISLPNVLQNSGREPLAKYYISLWIGFGLLPLQSLSMVSLVFF